MTYSVTIRKDGVISVIDPEVIDSEIAEQIADEIELKAKDLRSKSMPVLILVDASPLKKDSAEARGAMIDRLDLMDFDRMAVYGTKLLQTQSLNLVFRVARLVKNNPLLDKLKLFRDKQSAETWLREYHK